MELTRRDALAALAATGIATGCLDDPEVPAAVVDRLAAVAPAVYPADVAVTEPFLETYVDGRIDDRPAYRDAVAATLDELDDAARDLVEDPVEALDVDRRDALLRSLGVDTAEPARDGTLAERVRYHVVNELQYALYASPVGGRLVGIENPIGHPGGTRSYHEPP